VPFLIDGDPDVELNGDEGEDDGDSSDAARIESVDQSAVAARPGGAGWCCGNPEDNGEDTEDCDGFENEPLFDGAECARLNVVYGDGPGGGSQLDSDYDAGE
jgi:hypothetical protein